MPWLLAIVAALTAFSVHAADRGVSNAALARAAREARLDQIDDFRNHCHDSRRVEDWLKDVVGDTAKSVRWSGGRCQLVNNLNPLDGGTDWCGQAVIAPKHGKDVTIEVFFEKPGARQAGRALRLPRRRRHQRRPGLYARNLWLRGQLETNARPRLRTAE